jgi:hypothetical protein
MRNFVLPLANPLFALQTSHTKVRTACNLFDARVRRPRVAITNPYMGHPNFVSMEAGDVRLVPAVRACPGRLTKFV